MASFGCSVGHNCLQRPHSRIAVHYLGRVTSSTGNKANLPMSEGAIIDTHTLVLIHIEVQCLPTCYDGKDIWLIQPGNNR